MILTEEERRVVIARNHQLRKAGRIYDWKARSLPCDDFDKLHQKYVDATECDNCRRGFVHKLFGTRKYMKDDLKIVCASCKNIKAKDY